MSYGDGLADKSGGVGGNLLSAAGRKWRVGRPRTSLWKTDVALSPRGEDGERGAHPHNCLGQYWDGD